MGEKKEYPYKEAKTCKACGIDFVAASAFGNPYKWCPDCREKKFRSVERYAKNTSKERKTNETE